MTTTHAASAPTSQVFGETFAGSLADLDTLVAPPKVPTARDDAYVIRTCPICSHSPHGIGIICWHGTCPCRGNGGGHL